jgi:hypothetical protein
LTGADSICQSLANAAGLGESNWTALLSDGSTSANQRVSVASQVRNMNGDIVFDNISKPMWQIMGQMGGSFQFDENGNDIGNRAAWTNTTGLGDSLGSNHCSNWTTNKGTYYGSSGHAHVSSDFWINATNSTCNELQSLYCIEN